MTHDQALEALRENTLAWTRGEITWAAWDREVERVLDARYPSERDRQAAPRDEQSDLTHAIRRSTPPGMQPRADGQPRAARRALANAPDAP